MDVVLLHGMWFDATIWDGVVPALQAAGHATRALDLPSSPTSTLQDHIDTVLATVDELGGNPVLVAHSAGGGVAHAVAAARPGRIARVVHVGSEPRGTDEGGCPFPAVDGVIPFPGWDAFDAEMVADLDDEQRKALQDKAIPVPERAATDPLTLSDDDRRYDVPITMITCEYDGAMLREWIAQGEPGAQELGRMRDVEWVDLHSGHWPQVSRLDDLRRAILAAIDRT